MTDGTPEVRAAREDGPFLGPEGRLAPERGRSPGTVMPGPGEHLLVAVVEAPAEKPRHEAAGRRLSRAHHPDEHDVLVHLTEVPSGRPAP